MNNMEIKVIEEYLKDVPRMSEEEYQALKKDIEENGQDRPIIVNQDGVVLDGHHRFRACQELGREYNYEIKEFKDKIDERLYVFKSALLRRHLSEGQKTTVILRMEPLLAEKAKQRKAETIPKKGEKGFQPVSSRILENIEEGVLIREASSPIHTDKELAKMGDVSHDSIYRTRQIWKHEDELPEEDIKAFEAGEKSINSLYNDVVKIEDSKKDGVAHTPEEWAKQLEGKTDLERFELFGKTEFSNNTPRLDNVWNFTKNDDRLGQDHPGQIPGQIAMNILYYYTKPGDKVIDPMAGGGSTLDACKVMDRECKGYDIKPMRPDIQQHDISQGFPEEIKDYDLVFLDPPYGFIMEKEYSEESISADSMDNFMALMKNMIKESYDVLKSGGHVAFVMKGIMDRDWKYYIDIPFLCANYFHEAGFKPIERISAPIPSQVKNASQVTKYKKLKILFTLNRDILVFKKE